MTPSFDDAAAATPRDDLPEAQETVASLIASVREIVDELTRPTPGPDEPTTAVTDNLTFAADRLTRSVIRPLVEALAELDDAAGAKPRPDRRPGELGGRRVQLGPKLWQLAKETTTLRMRPGLPTQVQEAAAALQDLACQIAVANHSDDLAVRLGELAQIQGSLAPIIQASQDGPYLVTNVAKISNWLGERIAARPQMALCRCGASAIKPLCDGSHARIAFTSTKDPGRVTDRRDTYVGQQVTILDNRGICQHSGFCTERLADVFHVAGEPFVTPSGGRMDEIIRAVRDCPSGALSYAIDGREAREQVDHGSAREPSIEVAKDGPYRISGGIALTNNAGAPESRNDGASLEHYALCRCGLSQNKVWCSGMHWYVGFHDPLPDPDREPTVFEWCGGLPALTRMTRLFYEKYVPQDPLLAPLFATMSADHPQRVAKWLAEVFCGPRHYSEEYGGYPRMVSQHIGKGLTEEKRARWVALLLQSAQEAGLPNDPEWRSTFGAYIEWGSRLAVDNSQAGAKPPEHMPMPRWDWQTAAGPPGSRISALTQTEPEAEPPVVLPDPSQPVHFEEHIKPLFRQRDRQSMKFAFDLWSYKDVSRHADAIVERLRAGTMPCDGPWPQQKIEAFERWLATGRRQ